MKEDQKPTEKNEARDRLIKRHLKSGAAAAATMGLFFIIWLVVVIILLKCTVV